MSKRNFDRMIVSLSLAATAALWVPCCSAVQNDSQADYRKINRNNRITVRVYNFAGVSAPILASGEREASRILKRAGVEILWADCPVAMRDGELRANCHGLVSPTEIDLRILPESMAVKAHFDGGTLGFSAIDQDGEQGNLATIFYQRIEALAQFSGVHDSTILGHAAAHEIGHLLLCSIHHSASGIMRATWGVEDLKHMGAGGLFFSAEDSQRIRAQAHARGLQAPPFELFGSRVGK